MFIDTFIRWVRIWVISTKMLGLVCPQQCCCCLAMGEEHYAFGIIASWAWEKLWRSSTATLPSGHSLEYWMYLQRTWHMLTQLLLTYLRRWRTHYCNLFHYSVTATFRKFLPVDCFQARSPPSYTCVFDFCIFLWWFLLLLVMVQWFNPVEIPLSHESIFCCIG